MVGSLEPDIFVPVLIRRMARQHSRDVEDDARLLVRQAVLTRRLVGERIEPCKADLDVVLIHRESQVQQLQLSIVPV